MRLNFYISTDVRSYKTYYDSVFGMIVSHAELDDPFPVLVPEKINYALSFREWYDDKRFIEYADCVYRQHFATLKKECEAHELDFEKILNKAYERP